MAEVQCLSDAISQSPLRQMGDIFPGLHRHIRRQRFPSRAGHGFKRARDEAHDTPGPRLKNSSGHRSISFSAAIVFPFGPRFWKPRHRQRSSGSWPALAHAGCERFPKSATGKSESWWAHGRVRPDRASGHLPRNHQPSCVCYTNRYYSRPYLIAPEITACLYCDSGGEWRNT